MTDERLLRSCSPYFLTNHVIGPATRPEEMSELAKKAMRNELIRDAAVRREQIRKRRQRKRL